MIQDYEFDQIVSLITELTGIIPLESHKTGIRNYVDRQTENLSFAEYMQQVKNCNEVREALINSSTVNETYFFREEKQFSFLQKSFFPLWVAEHGSVGIRIWSAACSEGEEAYSLALMAIACNLRPVVTASDINTTMVEKCKKGEFKTTAVRAGDGEKYRFLLDPYIKNDLVVFPDNVRNRVHARQVNLLHLEEDNISIEKQDLIFLRNVFIYFSFENRKKILQIISDKYLNKNGIIVVSMNEIAQIDSTIMPDSLEKVFDGNIYYFKKK